MPHYTEQQIEAANNKSLVAFLNSHGEQLKKFGAQHLWEKHQVWIRDNRWYTHYDAVGGYAIFAFVVLVVPTVFVIAVFSFKNAKRNVLVVIYYFIFSNPSIQVLALLFSSENLVATIITFIRLFEPFSH